MNALEQKVEQVDEKVSFVESALGHFIISTTTSLNRLEKEMNAFKDEMKAFKDEMKEFKDEMKVFKDEMKVFKDEMKVFKDEMTEYKNWSKNMIDTMNAQWGNLARKMGTLVEDIFYPSSDIVIERYFKVKPDSVAARKLIRKGGEEFEVDILALCSDLKKAFIFEIKSNPDYTEAIGIFKKKLARAPELLDEKRL